MNGNVISGPVGQNCVGVIIKNRAMETELYYPVQADKVKIGWFDLDRNVTFSIYNCLLPNRIWMSKLKG